MAIGIPESELGIFNKQLTYNLGDFIQLRDMGLISNEALVFFYLKITGKEEFYPEAIAVHLRGMPDEKGKTKEVDENTIRIALDKLAKRGVLRHRTSTIQICLEL